MRRSVLQTRSLLYHWRVNLPVVLGAAVATSALTGALIVGDSMRASLAEIAVSRLGRVDHALLSQHFFREDLAGELAGDARFSSDFESAAPMILMQAGVVHAELRTRAGTVNLIGVDDRFWSLAAEPIEAAQGLSGRNVILNDNLAKELRAKPGDDILIYTSKPSAISTETLLGRRDDAASTLRLTVASVITARGLGGFTLHLRQMSARNAFIPLSTLQKALDQAGRVNCVLVSGRVNTAQTPDQQAALLDELLQSHSKLDDYELTLRTDSDHGYLALEARSILIPAVVEAAATIAAERAGLRLSPILTHLANSMALAHAPGETDAGEVPYSTIAAMQPGSPTAERLAETLSTGSANLGSGQILLNRWAADDLRAEPGRRIAVTYYVTGPLGSLETRIQDFELAGIVDLTGDAADPGFIPEYPGVTDTENLSDWDPPFPVDLIRIRSKDEDYWDRYRTTPKAFINLADGQRLWAGEGERFGRLTSIRLTIPRAAVDHRPAAARPAEAAGVFEAELLRALTPADSGMVFQAVSARALRASRGTTDFSSLFLGFSFFLIASACMLVALLFRLGVERRSNEVGVLLATGFARWTIAGQLVAEGVVLAGAGAVWGSCGAVGYAWVMLAGLGSWWSAAVNAPVLVLAISPETLLVGFVAGLLVAGGSAAWAVRGMTRRSARSLLGGVSEPCGDAGGARSRARAWGFVAGGSVLVAGILALASGVSEAVPAVAAFFAGGALTLIAGIAAMAAWLSLDTASRGLRPGKLAIARLALRNAPRHPGRSLLTAALIASATFLIIALESFRLDPQAARFDKNSGTGGFSLFAESAVPLPYDISSRAGQVALGIEDPRVANASVSIVPFRLRPGDTTSCTSLYVPTEPRIIGASPAFIARGGFRFAAAIEDKQNPWTLLDREIGPDILPAIGDEAAVRWQLHLGLGQDLPVTDQNGREVRLRFVALLKGSVLQDEIVVSDQNFVRMFPSISGQGFFLIQSERSETMAVEQALEAELSRFAFDAGQTADRLAQYNAVQNTYLSTFQSLGGLGLLLGTFGLAAVLLRNIWERRREFALLRAVGFTAKSVGALVFIENSVLVLWGAVTGAISAAVAIAPRVVADPADLPLWSAAGLLALVILGAVASGLIGFRSVVRAPLLPALRAD